jgi:hypothetical protein
MTIVLHVKHADDVRKIMAVLKEKYGITKFLFRPGPPRNT